MTQEQKQLLLIDLCGRLPYGVKLQHVKNTDSIVELYSIDLDDFYCKIQFYTYKGIALIASDEGKLLKPGGMLRYKPYLFPIESMTDEQMKECLSTKHKIIKSSGKVMYLDSPNTINYYHKNHIDYRGLIPMGLANDATGLNIY